MNHDGVEDHELLARYVGGDASAFDVIVDRYERRVYAITLRMCGDPEDARDVSQTVFIKALRALLDFREEAQLSTWFHRVAVNASLDHLRKRKRRLVEPLDSIGDRPTEGPGPEEQAIGASRAAEVQAGLQKLSEEHRAVLVLHDIQDLDYAAVSQALDIPVGTVKSRIHRARLELAKHLGHLREGTSEGTGRPAGPSNQR